MEEDILIDIMVKAMKKIPDIGNGDYYMNFGDCPYEDCDGALWLAVPKESLPKLAIVQCPDCGRDVWYKFSRIDPKAWTVADFEAKFGRNQKNMQLRL